MARKNGKAVELEPAMIDAAEAMTADRDHVVQLPYPQEGEPLLAETLPAYNSCRVFITEQGEERVAAAWLALNQGSKLSECRDPRLSHLRVEAMRGHGARLISPPRAALLQIPSSRNIVLMIQGLDNLASDRPGQWKPVGSYRLPGAARLPDDHPSPPPHVMPTEAIARCYQLYERADDYEMRNRWAPFSDELFAKTKAQAIDVRACLYRQPGSGSGVMFVEHHGFIWAVPGLVRQAGLRRASDYDQPHDVVQWHKEQQAKARSL